MLGVRYRYQAYNGTGVSVTVTVKDITFKFASDGSLTFSSETAHISAVSVSTVSYSNATSVDNSTNKYLGSDITWTAAPGSSATGTVSIYLQRSTDGGTTWPSDGRGEQISSIAFAASSTSVTKNAKVR
jgi:hypothetical protein